MHRHEGPGETRSGQLSGLWVAAVTVALYRQGKPAGKGGRMDLGVHQLRWPGGITAKKGNRQGHSGCRTFCRISSVRAATSVAAGGTVLGPAAPLASLVFFPEAFPGACPGPAWGPGPEAGSGSC